MRSAEAHGGGRADVADHHDVLRHARRHRREVHARVAGIEAHAVHPGAGHLLHQVHRVAAGVVDEVDPAVLEARRDVADVDGGELGELLGAEHDRGGLQDADHVRARREQELDVLLDALGGEVAQAVQGLRVEDRRHDRVIGAHHEPRQGERAHDVGAPQDVPRQGNAHQLQRLHVAHQAAVEGDVDRLRGAPAPRG